MPLDYLREVVRYWLDAYDWRVHEARLNRYQQFVTTVEGQRIHFLHVRSRHRAAVPLFLTHGWPGSVVEFLDVIDPLADPADPSDAFHLVVPSLPGYGFSGPTTETGWNPRRIAAAFGQIADRARPQRYGVQGVDWGAIVSFNMAELRPDRVLGLHVNLMNVPPPSGQAAAPPTAWARRAGAGGGCDEGSRWRGRPDLGPAADQRDALLGEPYGGVVGPAVLGTAPGAGDDGAAAPGDRADRGGQLPGRTHPVTAAARGAVLQHRALERASARRALPGDGGAGPVRGGRAIFLPAFALVAGLLRREPGETGVEFQAEGVEGHGQQVVGPDGEHQVHQLLAVEVLRQPLPGVVADVAVDRDLVHRAQQGGVARSPDRRVRARHDRVDLLVRP